MFISACNFYPPDDFRFQTWVLSLEMKVVIFFCRESRIVSRPLVHSSSPSVYVQLCSINFILCIGYAVGTGQPMVDAPILKTAIQLSKKKIPWFTIVRSIFSDESKDERRERTRMEGRGRNYLNPPRFPPSLTQHITGTDITETSVPGLPCPSRVVIAALAVNARHDQATVPAQLAFLQWS